MLRHILHRDIETRSTLDLTEVGVWRYAAEPTTGVWCVGYAIDDDPPQIWTPNQPIPEVFFIAAGDPNWTVIAHNDQFETAIEQRILAPRYGWPLCPQHRCTMAMVLACALPGSLDGAAEALNSPFRKDAEGQRLMRKMARPRKPRKGEDPNGLYWHDEPENQARLHRYCMRDTEAERWLYQRVPPLTDAEQTLWTLDQLINARGFDTDGALLNAAYHVVTETEAALQTEFRKLTGLDSTNQTAKLIAWLADHGCAVTDVQKGTLKHALRRNSLEPAARRAIELRLQLAHASAGKVQALLAWRGADGRVRGTLKFHGAGTGRWAGHGPQPQNFKRDGENTDEKIVAIMNGGKGLASPLEAVGEIARAMICAAPGHCLLIGDYGAIESRITAWASGQQSKIDLWKRFDQTGNPDHDPYVVFGRAIRHPEISARAYGKVGDLAFGFGGGVGAWRNFAPEDDTSDETTIKRYRDTWRAQHPKTVQFWYTLDRAAISAIRNPGADYRVGRFTYRFDAPFLRVKLPSGRSISYPFAEIMPEPDRFGHPRASFLDTANGGFGPCNFGRGAWGGIWCENVVSGAARDLLATAMMRLEAAGYRVVLHVHDEIVCETPTDFGSLEEFQRLIMTLPDWATDLPIAAKVRNGERFSKSEKPAPPARVKPGVEISDDLSIPSFLMRGSAPPIAPAVCDKEAGEDKPDDKCAAESELAQDAIGKDDNKAADQTADYGNDHDASRDPGGGYASGEQPRGPKTASYIYRDAAGAPYLRVVRTKAKQFPQYHWENGRWIRSKPKGPKIPYRLPELIAAAPDVPVLICEGEKDADNLAALGLICTTNSEGAGKGKWTADLNKWFAGKRAVYILEDNDEDGRRHAREVAGNLQHIVGEIRVVSFSELPPKGDVSDWLEDFDGTKEQLLARAKAAPRWQRDGYVLVRASDIVPRAMDWLWHGHILRGSQELLTGVPGNGKSQIHCAFVAYVTTGSAWPDGCNGAPAGNVIMLTAEDCLDQTIVPRLIAAGARRDRVFILKKIRKDNKERMFLLNEDLEELEHMIAKTGDVRLITIDPITAYMGGKLDSHRATDVRGQLGPLAELAERMDVALSAITHPPKNATQRAIDHFIGSQAFIAAARIGHMTIEEVSEDEYGNKTPTGRGLFTNPKNNVSRKMSTLAYRVVEKPLDDGIKAACVTWEEIVDITADQAIAAAAPAHKERGQQSDVIIFLMNLLAGGPVEMKIIEDKAAERGFTIEQLRRAKRKMGIVAFKQTGTMEGHWSWALAQHAPARTNTGEA